LKDFFEQSGNFSGDKLPHTPFLVFLEEGDTIRVKIIDNAKELLSFSDDTPVMAQWQGNYRSDFFQFTIGDYRPLAEEKRGRLEKSWLTAQNVIKRLGPNGGFRGLSFQCTADEGYTRHEMIIDAAKAAEIETFFNKHSILITVEREEKQRNNKRSW
jgi:hypothetical protein